MTYSILRRELMRQMQMREQEQVKVRQLEAQLAQMQQRVQTMEAQAK